MAATSTHADPAPRVPAWKRLGLKLKFAKDTPAEPQHEIAVASAPPHPPAAIEAASKPAKRPSEWSQTEAPAKRSRVEAAKPAPREKPFPGSAPKTRTAGQQVWNDEDRSSLPAPSGVFKAPGQTAKRIVFGDDDVSEPLRKEPSPPKQFQTISHRKSVSFTPDTKKEDTFSAQNLFKAWAAGEDPSEVTTKEPTEQSDSPSKAPKEPKQKKEKKEKKEKKRKAKDSVDDSLTGVAADPSSTEVPVYVKYLEQFVEDKASWKFSKNRQNDLFKHLFDIERIPSKYDEALVQYISTAQGQARRRISEQAEEVLKAIWTSENEDADPMSIDTPEGRRLAYFNALAASVKRYEDSGAGRTQFGDEKLKEVMREHEKGRRAELLLRKALEGELFPEQPKAVVTSSQATTPLPTSQTTPAIPRATRVIETQEMAPGQVFKTETNLRPEADKKRKRKSKSRTQVSSDSDSSDSSDSDSDSADESGPAAKKPSPPKTKSASSKPFMPALFDKDVLDKKFGKRNSYSAAASKR